MKKLLTIACVLFALAGAGQTTRWQTFSPRTTIAKYDTIPIIYLYCDTAKRAIREGLVIGGYPIWDFGYEVRNGWHGIIGYLDRHKNPIRKSIVIFMTKAVTDPPGEN